MPDDAEQRNADPWAPPEQRTRPEPSGSSGPPREIWPEAEAPQDITQSGTDVAGEPGATWGVSAEQGEAAALGRPAESGRPAGSGADAEGSGPTDRVPPEAPAGPSPMSAGPSPTPAGPSPMSAVHGHSPAGGHSAGPPQPRAAPYAAPAVTPPANPFAPPSGAASGEPVPPPPISPDGPGQVPYGYPVSYDRPGHPAYGYPGHPGHPSPADHVGYPPPAGHPGYPGYPPSAGHPGYAPPDGGHPGYYPGLPGAPVGYGWPAVPMAPSNGVGVTAMVLGIVAAVGFCLWPLAIVLGVVAIVLGAIGGKKVRRGEATNQGQALTGVICGVIGVLLGIAMMVFFLYLDETDSGTGVENGYSTSLVAGSP